jgi:hypothetical protein
MFAPRGAFRWTAARALVPLLACACVAVLLARAEPGGQTPGLPGKDQPGKDQPKVVTHMFQLKYAHASEAIKVLTEIYRPFPEGGFGGGKGAAKPKISLAVDDRTNTIIARGPSDEIEEIATLLQKLDTADDKDRADVLAYQFKYVEATGEVEETLRMVLPAKGPARFTIAADRRTVYVYGPEASILRAKQLLILLDQPGTGVPPQPPLGVEVQVRVFLFLNAPKDNDLPKLAAEFQPILGELRKLGVERPLLAAHATVATSPALPFEVTGNWAGGGLFAVSGSLGGPPDRTMLSIHIKSGGTDPARPQSSLRTVVPIVPGQMTVLGGAPSGGEPTAFVAQVSGRALQPKQGTK